jgi:hypothetical protein
MEQILFQKLYMKMIGKGIICVIGSFFSGFFLYYFSTKKKILNSPEICDQHNSKNRSDKSKTDDSTTEIPIGIMEKIIKKIKNKIIILLANLYDKTVLMNIAQDAKKKNEEPENKDIVVETISSGEIARVNDTFEQRSVLNTSTKKNPQKLNQLKTFFNCNS